LQGEISLATWDSPDVVWIGGSIPVSSLILGFIICLLMGWVPTLVFTQILYWTDRWEKEPIRLLMVAFFWGAVPALIVVLLLRIFVYLPPSMLGSSILDGGWLDWFHALVEETLKCIIVLWIAYRYRREFDNVLDGIIYGGMVGLGFAMNANIIGYLGSFLSMGFGGLSPGIFMEGVLLLVNHAFFTAIFGAGLGYARLSRSRWQRQIVPLGFFTLSVLTRIAFDRLNQNMVGFSLGTVFYSLFGILAMMVLTAWSLRRQRRCLVVELRDELPPDIYQAVLNPASRTRALWRIFKSEGLNSWRKYRRLYRISAEYAFKKQQSRLFPQEESILSEAQTLQDEIRLLAGME
jgi:RsiW-degrading membrane proteinase PrsW (M82 family)